MKLLFLGNNYNRFSLACLQELLSRKEWSLSAGIYDPSGGNAFRTGRKILREYGGSFLLRKGQELLLSRAQLALLKSGVKLGKPRSLEHLAVAASQPHFLLSRPNSLSLREQVGRIQPDLIVVAGFSLIIRPSVFELPSMGCINVHPSLLPKYRGPNPLYWVLKYRESVTGITVHYVDAGIDTGDVILQESMQIRSNDNEITLLDRAIPIAGRLLVEAIRQIVAREVVRTPQDESQASYFSLPPRGESLL